MNRCVVDASVGVKWLFPETGTESALALFKRCPSLVVPDLFYAEIANAIWKRVVFNKLDPEEARVALGGLLELPLEVFPSDRLALAGLAIACSTKRTVYDSLYLALAVQEECPLITADIRFYNSLRQGPLGKHLRWIGDEES